MGALLAKSRPAGTPPRRGDTLAGHTHEVLQAGRALLAACGAQALAACGLEAGWQTTLERRVLAACLLHDLGKCSDHFQAMLQGSRAGQLVRHEALSALILAGPLAPWLEQALPDPADRACVLAAIAGHHRRFPKDAESTDPSQGLQITAQLDHGDVAKMLRLGAGLGWPAPPACAAWTLRAGSRGELARRLDSLRLLRPAAGEPPALWALVKGLALAADVAGSALPREGEHARWIGDTLAARASGAELHALAQRRLGPHPPRPFQAAVGACAAPVALVTAGCGSGKTVAAWLWAAQHPGRQVWFAYPTTGTATEGFRDYLVDVDLDTALEHSRREVDLELLGVPGEAGPARERDRLEALRVWGRQAISCTVDTVLGLLQCQRKGLYALPALVGSAVVFDEIHAYDDRLFGALLRWLRALPGLPALLMTASLPAARLRALEALVQEVHGQPLARLDGPTELEALPRYVNVQGEPWAALDEALGRGERVLWVCNTVDRCQQAAAACAERGWPTLVYHSRFRYEDRVARHAALIEAFRRPGPVVACTTQVAEMSLDLSAELLITERAPVPALIQRLGRLNRRATPEQPGIPRPFVVLEPPHPAPYSAEELAAARAWEAALPAGALSQQELAQAWTTGAEEAGWPTQSAWLDGGPETEEAPLRELTPGVVVVLRRDAAALRAQPRQAARFALPMPPPRVKGWQAWPRVEHLLVAEEGVIHYDEQRGAQWRV